MEESFRAFLQTVAGFWRGVFLRLGLFSDTGLGKLVIYGPWGSYIEQALQCHKEGHIPKGGHRRTDNIM
ncbi:hypothetical protein XELAEV_18022885mg [Xenopus laevis]|uniref:Uncharacterized protein n=1 Tax=Xenopus laevis TaxID=8355 RepID=A0A974D337_XENLA|nr:hypothetical protein XELAEV_18022885mg [Xenopus laevis]